MSEHNKTLGDIIREGLDRNNEVDMKAIYRENTRKLESQRANDVQYGGDHYKRMGIQPWDIVDTWTLDQQVGYYRGCALKYVMRMGHKDDEIQEIQKAIHCLQKLADALSKTKTIGVK